MATGFMGSLYIVSTSMKQTERDKYMPGPTFGQLVGPLVDKIEEVGLV
jgi:hypothetical protein